MKTLLKKFETSMVAASFAEEGELATAAMIMNEDRLQKSKRPAKPIQVRPGARKELRVD